MTRLVLFSVRLIDIFRNFQKKKKSYLEKLRPNQIPCSFLFLFYSFARTCFPDQQLPDKAWLTATAYAGSVSAGPIRAVCRYPSQCGNCLCQQPALTLSSKQFYCPGNDSGLANDIIFMVHCLTAALRSIYFNVMCLFIHCFTTLLPQLFIQASFHKQFLTMLARCLNSSKHQLRHHSPGLGSPRAVCHRGQMGGQLTGLCKMFPSLMHTYILPQSLLELHFWLVSTLSLALHHFLWSLQALLPPRVKCRLILGGSGWKGNVHMRNGRVSIAGFGIVGSAVVVYRTEITKSYKLRLFLFLGEEI